MMTASSAPPGEASPRWDLRPRELLLIFVFWTSLAVLSSVNRLVDPRGFGFRFGSPAAPITLAFLEAWFWAAVTPLVFWLTSRLTIERSKWMTRVPLLIVAGIVIAIFGWVVLESLRIEIMPMARRRGVPIFAPLHEIGRFRFVNQLLVYAAIVAAGFAREYFTRDQKRQREATELRAQLTEARLNALRMQLNPHFLFNTLNAISALVERDPAGVRRMIARLSELLRGSLENQGTNEIPLRDEIAFLDKYLELMAVRFQGKLHVERRIDSSALDAMVPAFILQPLLENALEHGVSRIEGTGIVEISAQRSGDSLVLAIRDNGPGIDASSAEGLGVSNTRSRLAHMYGSAGALDLSHSSGGGTTALIRMPYKSQAPSVELRVD